MRSNQMSRRFHANAKEISRHPGPLFSYSPLAHTSFYYSVSGTYTLSGYSRGPRAVENEEPQDTELEAKCTENKYKNSRILESENQQERRERGQELSLFSCSSLTLESRILPLPPPHLQTKDYFWRCERVVEA
jgi:hypothetical protein